jgi:thymidine phosphorylase
MKEYFAKKDGYIVEVNNSLINQIAKASGCPTSKSSGVEIIKKQGAKIKEGDIVLRLYSHSESKLRRAEKIYNATGGPIRLGGMVIERI